MKSYANTLICGLLFFSSSSYANCNSLSSLNWLLGNWESVSASRVTTESWWRVSDDSFEGSGQSFNGQALASSESLRLVTMSDAVFYLAKVAQNTLPVAFKLTQCGNENAIFENQNHDFPQRFEYTKVNENEMTINVSDMQGKGFTLSFNRLNSDTTK